MLNRISKLLSSSRSLLAVSVVLMLAFAGLFYVDTNVKDSARRLQVLTVNAERILNADRSNTVAVRLAASLQSDRYIVNYQNIQDAKYDLLKENLQLYPGKKVQSLLKKMENVQGEIEDAESEAISLIDDEKWEEALELVTEPAFGRLKGIYRSNLSTALREMIQLGQEQATRSNTIAKSMQVGVIAMFLVLALIGFLYSREMQTSLARQSELAKNLEDSNENLEHRVLERTDELRVQTSLIRMQHKVALDANEAVSMEDALQKSVDAVCVATDWPVGHVYTVISDSDTKRLVSGEIWHLGDPQKFDGFRQVTEKTRLAPGEGLPGRVYESRQPVWIENVVTDPNFPRVTENDGLPIKSAFAFPVTVDGEIVAVLEFFTSDIVEPDQLLLDTLAYLGNLLGRVADRKNAEMALKENEERLRSLMDMSLDGVLAFEGEGIVNYWNPAAEKILAISPDDIIGDSFVNHLIPDRYRAEAHKAMVTFAKTGEWAAAGKPMESQVTRQDGSEVTVEVAFSTYRQNDVWRAVGFFRDVTERKAYENALAASESKIRRLFETANEGVWTVDMSAMTVDANSSMCVILGREHDDIVGRSIFDFVDAENKQIFLDQLEARKRGASGAYEISLTRSDGALVPCLFNATPMLDEQGEQTGSFAMVTDISERKKAEEDLAEKEAYLSLALDNMSDGMFLMGKDENYILINDRYKELTQLPPELLSVGKSVRGVVEHLVGLQGFPTLQSEKAVDERMDQLAGSQSVRMEMHVPNGPILELRNAPAADVGSVIVATDITQAKAAAEALREARDAAEDATKAKANFLAAMSHEIRTPMNGVVGMIDLLSESPLDEDQQQMVGTVRSSAYSLLTVINDILDFSKIEAGKLDLEEIPISISDAVESVCEALAVTARNKDLRLCVYVDPDIPDGLIGDQVRLRQVIFNLGGNAIKFTEKGKVLIRADRIPNDDEKSTTVRLQVIDKGIGIPEKAQKSLFQAFSQVDASTTRRFGGTGLGLSISQRLTELMGGEIGVESVEGEGSTFHVTITLPIAEEHGFSRAGEDLDGLRVLFALGDPELRDLMPRYLEHWQARTAVVGSMADVKATALAAAGEEDAFDAIVLGSSWALEDQIALIDELSAIEELSAKYVVACGERSRKERKALGNTVYVDADPMQRDVFIRGVAVAVGRASPDIEYDDSDIKKDPGKAPSVEEAAAMGQLILLAEDNLTNQNVITRQLAVLGYAAEIANDGVEAVERWKNGSYAILLTDCHMPNMDGFELTKTIRSGEAGSVDRLPIVAITASVMKEEIDNCYGAGMDDYLPKPVEMDKLRTMLRKWMPAAEEEVPTEEPPLELPPDQADKAEPAGEADDPARGPIDPSALKDVFGDDDETFKEILGEFVEPAKSNVQEIIIAFEERSSDGVAKGAHKLKSSSRAVGANDLSEICAALELAGKDEDWTLIDGAAPKLEGALTQVVDYINAL